MLYQRFSKVRATVVAVESRIDVTRTDADKGVREKAQTRTARRRERKLVTREAEHDGGSVVTRQRSPS